MITQWIPQQMTQHCSGVCMLVSKHVSGAVGVNFWTTLNVSRAWSKAACAAWFCSLIYKWTSKWHHQRWNSRNTVYAKSDWSVPDAVCRQSCSVIINSQCVLQNQLNLLYKSSRRLGLKVNTDKTLQRRGMKTGNLCQVLIVQMWLWLCVTGGVSDEKRFLGDFAWGKTSSRTGFLTFHKVHALKCIIALKVWLAERST